jgi:ribosomal protein L24E
MLNYMAVVSSFLHGQGIILIMVKKGQVMFFCSVKLVSFFLISVLLSSQNTV